MRKTIGVIIVSFFMFFCACSSVKYSHEVNLMSPLKDNGLLKVTIEITMDDGNGLKEIQQKTKTLQRAFAIVFREYRSKQLKGSGRGTVMRVLERVFDSKLQSEVKLCRIIDYNVRGPNEK